MQEQTIKTSKPYDELLLYASNNELDAEELDFKVIHYETIVTKDGATQTFLEHELEIFNDDEYFNSDIKIEQVYEISFVEKIYPLIDFKIGSNKNITKVVANFNALNCEENIELTDLVENIRDILNKRLIKAGILLGVREFNFQEQLGQILRALIAKELVEANVIIARGLEPKSASNSYLKTYYKDKKSEEVAKKLDYSKRGFINAVSKDELIMEFIKPVEAINGKDLRGLIVPAPKATLNYAPDFKVSPNINAIDDEKSIKYFANINGYITKDDGFYDIKDSVSVKAVQFKTTGSIEAGLNKDITLNIDEQDHLKDAVGANLSIEVSTLNVKGNVAQNSTVRAKTANIGGQTHSKSKIYAKNAQIDVHRGYCEGEEVNINRLENGTVVGRVVKIKQAIGGKIIANKLVIDILKSNVNIEVSDFAIIKECQGENNKFLVSASKSPIITKSLDNTLKGLNEIKNDLSVLPKQIEAKRSIIDANKESIIQIKQRMQELSKSGITPPAAFMQKIKDYQAILSQLQSLIEKLKNVKDKQKDLEDNLKVLQNRVYDAKVINLSSWTNMNEIKFKLLYPNIELAYSTKAGEQIYGLKLEKIMKNEEESARIIKLNKADIGDLLDEFIDERQE